MFEDCHGRLCICFFCYHAFISLYSATARVFETIATKLGDDHENAVAIAQLHTEIQEQILIAERKKQSTMD